MTLITPYQKAALNYERHISLTANAGSGKTFVLSKRFVEIALQDNVSLNSIVAITFTDKAASELHKKIAGEINTRLDNTSDDSEYKKLLRIRRQLVSAKISTIHSFCSELLREFSPDAGLDANFSLVDQTVANDIIEKEVFDYLTANLTGAREKEIKYLVRVVGSFSNLADEFRGALHKIKNIRIANEVIYKRSDDEILQFFNEKFNHLYELLIASKTDSIIRKLNEINVAVLDAKPDSSNGIEVASLLNRFPECNLPAAQLEILKKLGNIVLTKDFKLRKQGFLNKQVDNFVDDQQYLSSFFADLQNFELPENADALTKDLVEFGRLFIDNVLNVAENYAGTKKKYGYLDYEDLLHFTEILVEHKKVRDSLSSKYKYIMIDEYQDTNEIQYNIFLPILDKLNSGNLFVVGDEKQSIYMFRDAELQVFERTKDIIREKTASSGILELPHSFRLSPKIAFFCNVLFNRLFENPVIDFNEVASSELVSTRNDFNSGEIEFLLDSSGDRDAEAKLVANKIIQIHNEQNIVFDDIAVLVRKRKSFESLETIFTDMGIPYKILGGRGFYQQQVVYDIYSFLSFLTDRTNNSSLIAILRSPFFMISDRDIFQISKCRGETFYARLVECSIGNDQLSQVVELLDKLYRISHKIELSELVRRILKYTGYWSVIAARSNSKQDIANINKVLELAKNYNKHSFKTIYDYVDFLGTSINRFEDEGQARIPDESDSVNLMTIHQSKGLEFEAVFIYNSHMVPQSDYVKAKSISTDKSFGVLAKLPENNNYFGEYVSAPVLGVYNYISQRKSSAENQRLLYVALTRAINNLYICGTMKKSASQNSFISLIQQGLGAEEFSDNLHLEGSLKLMLLDENDYKFSSENIELDICITGEVENQSLTEVRREENDINSTEINTGSVVSSSREEIISATKINIYSQCPLKYNLTYNLGYTDLFKRFNLSEIIYANPKEDEETVSVGDLKGRIIHSLLENEIPAEELGEEIKKNLQCENIIVNSDNPQTEAIVTAIKEQVLKYYNSNIYSELNRFSNSMNEYEVYLSMNDYYLYGIIDKFIVAENELIIVDYKTDSVSQKSAGEKYNYYRNQLIFYAFILKRHLNLQLPVTLNLVFIDKPELSIVEKLKEEDLKEFGTYLDRMVKNIRQDKYPKNFEHCSKCHFTLKNKCVVK